MNLNCSEHFNSTPTEMEDVETTFVKRFESVSSSNMQDADQELGDDSLPTFLAQLAEEWMPSTNLEQNPRLWVERSEQGPELGSVIRDFLPHEVQRWGRLRDCMLVRADFEEYIVKVDLNEDSSWSMDEAFGSFLLDCLETDLAHGDTVTSEDADDAVCDDEELLQVFPHQCVRWERLRNRLMSIPYMDRCTKTHPGWPHNELFTCCLLDRLEEQLENEMEQAANKRASKLAKKDHSYAIVYKEVGQVVQEAWQADEEAWQGAWQADEGAGQADDDSDELSMEDDPNDPDYKPATWDQPGIKKASMSSEKMVETRTAREQKKASMSSEKPVETRKAREQKKVVKEKSKKSARPKQKVFVCDICNKPVGDKSEAFEHFKMTHWDPPEAETSQGETKSLCDSNFFATKRWHCLECDTYVEDLRKHKQTCPGVKCEVCGKQFPRRSMLRYHMKRRHTTNKEEFKKKLCHYCGQRFYCRSDLNFHLQRHRGEVVKNHKCDACGKAFTTPDRLARHNAIHMDEKPFPCSYCGQRFAQKHNMKLHTRIHTGVKPYKCDLCDSAFTHNVSLKNHKKKVHDIDWWQQNDGKKTIL